LPVIRELDRRGWRTKRWRTRKGHFRGGRAFTPNTLRKLLSNVTYLGRIRYRQEVQLCAVAAPAPVPAGRAPRVAPLLALALRFERLIGAGVIANYTALAVLAEERARWAPESNP